MKPTNTQRDYVITLAELKTAFKVEGTVIKEVTQLSSADFRVTTVEAGELRG